METWKVKVTTTTIGDVHEVDVESRLEQETTGMLRRDTEIEKEKKLPEGRKDEAAKKKRIFNTRGKINSKESKELQRTHKNIFKWVRKERSNIGEKDPFGSREQV